MNFVLMLVAIGTGKTNDYFILRQVPYLYDDRLSMMPPINMLS